MTEELELVEICCLCNNPAGYRNSREFTIMDNRGFANWIFCENCHNGKSDVECLKEIITLLEKHPIEEYKK